MLDTACARALLENIYTYMCVYIYIYTFIAVSALLVSRKVVVTARLAAG
jgi:hypothetical protein